jgi:hypothetical protein
MHNTIAAIWFVDNLMHHLAMAQYHIDPLYAGWLDVLNDMWTEADIMVRSRGDAEEMAAGMKRWNEEVIDTVPSERLLVWWPTDGWEPLCEFLEVPVPDGPVPNVNDTENFQKNLIMGPAIGAINAWWEENKPQERQPGHLDSEDAAADRGPATASA